MFSRIEEAIGDLKAGKFVIVVDGHDRENEGDLVIAAEDATPAKINFLISHARGILCIPMEGRRLDELALPLMVRPHDSRKCAFTVSADFIKGTTTGTSAADRAATIRALADEGNAAEDFSKPGHVFPLRAMKGGVLVREGHTEASIDLARLSGKYPAAVICEILNEDGSMGKLPQIRAFSQRHGIKVVSIADLKRFIVAGQSLNSAELKVM